MTTREITRRIRVVLRSYAERGQVRDVQSRGVVPAGYNRGDLHGAVPDRHPDHRVPLLGRGRQPGHSRTIPVRSPLCGPSLALADARQAQRFGAEFQAGEAKGFDLAAGQDRLTRLPTSSMLAPVILRWGSQPPTRRSRNTRLLAPGEHERQHTMSHNTCGCDSRSRRWWRGGGRRGALSRAAGAPRDTHPPPSAGCVAAGAPAAPA